ncbi:hypothetical protein [Burkholderia ubonensis]|uniref:hypothetical protein n=1 Tax=Burkholderia ubonensis TaxID=101571 RepID=UPI0009B56A28|nr:hypothetical protein [Burkholderia ubonensis]
MDIREIQALHAQYSSQPVVIDITSHVRALPAPVVQESTLDRAAARLASACRRYGRPTALALALALGAGVGGVCVAKLWHALHTPQAAAIGDPTTSQRPSTTPTHTAATSAPLESKRQLTGADFVEPAERGAASVPRMNAEALQAANPLASPAYTKPASPAATSDLEKAAASPVRAPRAAAGPVEGRQPVAAAPTQAAPHRTHHVPVRQRQDAASAEASATHSESAKAEHTPKPATPSKAGDVPLF